MLKLNIKNGLLKEKNSNNSNRNNIEIVNENDYLNYENLLDDNTLDEYYHCNDTNANVNTTNSNSNTMDEDENFNYLNYERDLYRKIENEFLVDEDKNNDITTSNTTSDNEDSDDDDDNDTNIENHEFLIDQQSIDYIYYKRSLFEKTDLYKNFSSIEIKSLEIYLHEDDHYPIYIEKKDFLNSTLNLTSNSSNSNNSNKVNETSNRNTNNMIDNQLGIHIHSPNINLIINSLMFHNNNNSNHLFRIVPSPMLLFYELLFYLYIYENFIDEIIIDKQYLFPYYQIKNFKYFNHLKDYLNDFDDDHHDDKSTMDIEDFNNKENVDTLLEDEYYNQSLWSICINSINQSSSMMPYNHLTINITIKPL